MISASTFKRVLRSVPVMLNFLIHFVFGSVVALILFLGFAKLSGTRSFSAPFGVVLVGFMCALLAHFATPWATPGVLVLYALVLAKEWRDEVRDARKAASNAGQP